MKIIRYLLPLVLILMTVLSATAREPIVIGHGFKEDETFVQTWRRVLVEAYKRSGLPFEFQSQPIRRVLVEANLDRIDAIAVRLPIIEKDAPNLVRVPTPVLPPLEFVAFAKRRGIPVYGWDSLRKLRAVSIKGMIYVERKTQGMGVTFVETPEQAFDMLAFDRADVVVFDKTGGMLHTALKGLCDIRPLSPPLGSPKMYHYMHKKHADTALPKLDAALRSMIEDGTVDEIVRTSNLPTCPKAASQ